MIKYKKFLLLVLCIFILGTFVSACGGGGKSTPPSYPFIPTPTPEQYQLELSQTEFTVNVGETDNITVTLNGEDITQTATYTVDEEAIASVEGGLITGLSVGVATVTVHAENAIEDKTFTVNVIDPSLPTLEAEPSEINLGIDEGATVKVTLNGEDVTEKVNYKSDNESIATVEKGIVKSKYIEGTANITVSLEGANSATFKVNVTDDSEEVTLNDDVLDQLHELGIIAKGSDDKTELTEANIPAVFKYNDQKYKITSIGEYAFENCSSLTSITMPESITSIEDSAFSHCSLLTSITIPESVTSIGDSAFYDCSSLTSVIIPEGVTSIEYGTFRACSSLTSITMPESITYIEDSAFSHCSLLTSITIPESVTSIGEYAFENCSSLTSITMPESITSIGMYAFEDCSSLTSIIIPEGVTSIEYGTFIACSSLTNVTIPKTVNIISNSAFKGCSLLENVTIEDGYNVLCIFPLAFYDCDNLTKLNTTNGKEITIPTTEVSKTDENVTFIGAKLYSPDIQGEIVIPNGITKIPPGAFYNCSKLTGVTIPDSVTSIIDYAFYRCENLTTVTIPEGVTSIGYRAFYNCSKLTGVAIPDSVTSIGEYAFYNVAEITYNSQMTATGTPWGAKKVNGVAQ